MCLGSGDVRDGIFSGCDGVNVLGWGHSARGTVRFLGIVGVAEDVDEGLQFAKVMGEVVADIKRVALSGIGTLDGTVRLRRLGRQDAVRGDFGPAGGLSCGNEIGAVVNLLSAPRRQLESAMSDGGAAQGRRPNPIRTRFASPFREGRLERSS